ncbi:hypothetical protein FPHYL_2162 [Fusarium phyllophilum]|uniref:IDI-2 n=1 Tax=Fusarium phyllophilum TaxID=47803 RepID=A0A8H5NK32_9HYPO|nr:hypothetical protein FPHYL_2162 [Fusarium phyllophilum]
MKYNSTILVLAYSTLISAGPSTISGAEAVCGDLGILQVPPGNLPDGVEPSDLRLCADRPLVRNRTLDPAKGASLAPLEEGDIPDTTPTGASRLFQKRRCYYGAPYGCSDKYCWKSCGAKGSGKWCWTATAGGVGPWARCKSWEGCGTNGLQYGCGKNCVLPGVCGCSC